MIKEKFNKFVSNHIQLTNTIALGLTILIGVLFCYYFLPILLNYAPGSINTDFDREFSGGLTYFLQFVLIYLAIFVLGNIWLSIATRDFKNIKKYLNDIEHSNSEEVKNKATQKLNKIKVKCITLPRQIFVYIAIIPIVGLLVVFSCLNFLSVADFKVILIGSITALLVASLRTISI